MNTRRSCEPKQHRSRSKSTSTKTGAQDFVSFPLLEGQAAEKFFGLRRPPKFVAMHEAGHLVAALVLKLPLCRQQAATIIPDQGLHGSVSLLRANLFRNGDVFRDRTLLENYAICYLAGRAADEIRADKCFDSYMFTLAEGDLATVDDILPFLLPSNSTTQRWQFQYELEKHYREVLLARAHSLLSMHWSSVLRVAAALLKRKVLSACEARKIAAVKSHADTGSICWPGDSDPCVAKKWRREN